MSQFVIAQSTDRASVEAGEKTEFSNCSAVQLYRRAMLASCISEP